MGAPGGASRSACRSVGAQSTGRARPNRSGPSTPEQRLRPMKSEAPTPTRAPDNQFRKMQDELTSIRNTSLPNFRGWGSEVPITSVRLCVTQGGTEGCTGARGADRGPWGAALFRRGTRRDFFTSLPLSRGLALNSCEL